MLPINADQEILPPPPIIGMTKLQASRWTSHFWNANTFSYDAGYNTPHEDTIFHCIINFPTLNNSPYSGYNL